MDIREADHFAISQQSVNIISGQGRLKVDYSRDEIIAHSDEEMPHNRLHVAKIQGLESIPCRPCWFSSGGFVGNAVPNEKSLTKSQATNRYPLRVKTVRQINEEYSRSNHNNSHERVKFVSTTN